MASKVGLSIDGYDVFDTGVDSIGRKVTKTASGSMPGLLDSHTFYFAFVIGGAVLNAQKGVLSFSGKNTACQVQLSAAKGHLGA